ncbi:MAG: hypothetical protein RL272_993 [Candidatus Parcubacteria bacterium]|jgi:poly-gamma-glutamate synthesis protein (capsule biosynthesis protein)
MRRVHALLIVTAPAFVLLAALQAARVPPRADAPVRSPGAAAAGEQAEAAPARAQASLPIAPAPPAPRVTLVAVGDVMLSRNVGKAIRARADARYPFLRMRDYLADADIAFANLETAVTPGRPIDVGEMTFRSDPETVEGLKDAGFDVVSLANNHTPNFGQKGLEDTFRYLREAGIAFAGAGTDAASAHAPAFVERHGLRFAFLAYNDADVVPASYAAGPSHAGTAFMDAAAMSADVRAARGVADVVIVSMHSGREYRYAPDASQIAFARAAIDAGANLVIGHHPHVVQTVERYKDRLIFYSLGNFVFDQMWSDPTREGLAVKFTFDGPRVARADVVPVQIDDYAQPHPSGGDVAARTLARLATGLADLTVWRWDADTRTFAESPPMKALRPAAAGLDDAETDLTSDIDGDGNPELISLDGADADRPCAERTIVVRKTSPDGAETDVWRSPPRCYAGVGVARLDGSTYLTGRAD